jgi:hypothetical protein
MSIKTAIACSINTNSIVHVDVDGDLMNAMYTMTRSVYDYDYTVNNDGNLDVYGTDDDGNTFRVVLQAA